MTNCRNDDSGRQKKSSRRFFATSKKRKRIVCRFRWNSLVSLGVRKPLHWVVWILQKFLAQGARQSEGRSAMSTFARSTNRGRAFVATCVSAAFLWALALSASPQLHQRVHPDAGRAEHNCAATMIASGNYNHAAHPLLVSAPVPVIHFSKIPALTPQWVESPFLGACIFEHAPPARA